MKRAIIVHGWGADSTSNWFPWLANELKKNGFEVLVPNFPNTQNPVLSEWLEHFSSLDPKGLESTVLIGHSLGTPFIMRLLEKSGKKVKSCFLVSGFHKPLGFPEIENFVDKPFNFQKIMKGAGKIVLINSDNDPYIPFSVAKDLAKNLGIELLIEPNGEHINAPGGFLAYPRLLKLILQNK